MKFRQIFQFEFRYQLCHFSTWVYVAIPPLFVLLLTKIADPTEYDINVNATFFIISGTVFSGLVWLLSAGAIAGNAAARDFQTGLHPLMYAAPVSKLDYLGGRFMAAFMLNILIQLTIPVFYLLAMYVVKIQQGSLGPFQPEAYLTTFFYLALPNTFVVTACQFSIAVQERRAIGASIGSILIFPIVSHIIGLSAAESSGNRDLWRLIDLSGINLIPDMESWSAAERNTRLIALEGMFLWNRLIWISVALVSLAYTYARFRFSHPVESTFWSRLKRKRRTKSPINSESSISEKFTVFVPKVDRAFGFATYSSQIRTIALSSFRTIARSKFGLPVIAFFALHRILFAQGYLKQLGVPQIPTTANVLSVLTAPLRDVASTLIIIPMLTVFFAGELVWREREARVNRISDTFPVSEWVLFLGKFLGLGLIILVWLFFLLMAGIFTQLYEGYTHFELVVYLKALFGFQLADYLLFALLALVIHVVVNQKYLGHLVVLIVYVSIAFSSRLGIEHNLLIYGGDPGWSYTDMRGFEPNVAPWLWFKLYWTGWALLLAVVARLLWVRSMSEGLNMRIQLIRPRFTRPTIITTTVAAGVTLLAGIYIFYNTNVLNNYNAAADVAGYYAHYEQSYKKYADIPQPRLTAIQLSVELYPSQQKAEVRGIYSLVNRVNVPIDSIHLTTKSGVETGTITFDRPATPSLEDKALGYHIYKLAKPLQPGDSLRLRFEVRYQVKGFRNKRVHDAVLPNGTYFVNHDWMPAIGYQATLELRKMVERKKYGLKPRIIPSPFDTTSRAILDGQELTTFEAVMGTEKDQIAVAPGALLRKWTKNGRNYFQYATSAPTRNTYSFFSAVYALSESNWVDSSANPKRQIAVKIYHHPAHTENIDRLKRSINASLRYYTTKFGPYPYSHLTIVERSGGGALNAEPTTIDYGENFTLANFKNHPDALDIVYFGMSHEVSHQWWGAAQLTPAPIRGGILLSETLANYSGLNVLEEAYGDDQSRKLRSLWRDSYEVPRARTTAPLLLANDRFLGYRKGPLALYALTKYIGRERVNSALRQLLAKHASGGPPLPTSLNLYQELKAVTPDSLHYLLRDYFEKNIYWQLKTEEATAQQLDKGKWQVRLKLNARKAIVDGSGTEIVQPMNDWIEIGVFARHNFSKPLYLQKQRIRAGNQTITVNVAEKPSRAGIDPNYLLFDLEPDDNTRGLN
ncbi:M1 family aminopeptidase [Spirosoma flavus]